MMLRIMTKQTFGTLGTQTSPGETVKGYIDVENSYTTSVTADVLWCYGSYDESTGNFSARGYAIIENVTFSAESSQRVYTGSFSTPNDPGTWDCYAAVAQDIQVVNNEIQITGLYAQGVALDAWTISGVAGEIKIVGIGVEKV